MSSTIEDKVVKLSFDSKDFDKGLKKTRKELDEFEHKMKLEDGVKSLALLQKTFDKLDLSEFKGQLDKIESRLSVFGIAGAEIVRKMTDSMITSFTNLYAVTLGQIKSGGKSRATNIENAHFLLQGLLSTEEEVQKVMDVAMDSVDGTAYGFDAAAKAAAQFTASGLSVEELMGPLKAIAGVAATTSSDYESLSNIFTKVAGTGRAMTMELNQLSGYGINAASSISDYLNKVADGTYIVSSEVQKDIDALTSKLGKSTDIAEADVRNMASAGLLSFRIFSDAMAQTFGDHAKKANETLTGALSNVKASLSRIGAEFYSPLIEQNGPLVKMFNNLRIFINQSKKMLMPFLNDAVEIAKKLIGVVSSIADATENKVFINLPRLIGTINDVAWTLTNTVKQLLPAFSAVFGNTTFVGIIDRIVLVINRVTYAVQAFTAEMTSEGGRLYKPFVAFFKIIKLISTVVSKAYYIIRSLVGEVKKAIKDVFGNTSDLIIKKVTEITKKVQEFGLSIRQQELISGIIRGVVKLVKGFIGVATVVYSYAWKLFVAIQPLIEVIADLFVELTSSKSAGDTVKNALTKIGDAISWVIDKIGELSSFINTLYYDIKNGNFDKFKEDLFGGLRSKFEGLLDIIKEIKDWFNQKFEFHIFDNVEVKTDKAVGFFGNIKNAVVGFVTGIYDFIKSGLMPAIHYISDIISSVAEPLKASFTDTFNMFTEYFDELKENFKDQDFQTIFQQILEFIKVFSEALVNFGMGKGLSAGLTGLGEGFSGIGSFFDKGGKFFNSMADGIERLFHVKKQSKGDKFVAWFKSLAKSILLIAIAITIVGLTIDKVGKKTMWWAIAMLEVVMLSFVLILKILENTADDMKKKGTTDQFTMITRMFMRMAIAMILIAMAFKKIMKVATLFEDPSEAAEIMLVITLAMILILGAMTAMVWAFSKMTIDTKQLAAIGAFILAMSFALNSIVISFIEILAIVALLSKLYGPTQVAAIVGGAFLIISGIILLLVLFAAAMVALSNYSINPLGMVAIGASLIMMATALDILVVALAALAGVIALSGGTSNLMDALKIIALLAAILVVMGFVLGKIGPFVLLAGKGMLMLVQALVELIAVLLVLSFIPMKVINRGLKKLLTILKALILPMALFGLVGNLVGMGLIKMGAGILLLAFGLQALALAITAIYPLMWIIKQIVVEFISIIFDIIVAFIKKLVGGIGEVIREICRQIILTIPYLVKALQVVLGALIDQILWLLDKIGALDFIEKVITKILTFLDNLATALIDRGSEIADTIINVLMAVLENVILLTPKLFAALGSFVYDLVTSGLDKLKEVLGIHSPSTVLEKLGYYCGEGFKLGIQLAWKGIKAWVKLHLKLAKKLLIDFPKFMFEIGKKMGKALIDGLKTLKDSSIGDWIKDRVNDALSIISDPVGSMISMGGKLVKGLADGLLPDSVSDKVDSIVDTLTTPFDKVSDFWHSFWDENFLTPIGNVVDELAYAMNPDNFKTSMELYAEKFGLEDYDLGDNGLVWSTVQKWIEEPEKLAKAWNKGYYGGNEMLKKQVQAYDTLVQGLDDKTKQAMGIVYETGNAAAVDLIEGFVDPYSGINKETMDARLRESIIQFFKNTHGSEFIIDPETRLVDEEAMMKAANEFADRMQAVYFLDPEFLELAGKTNAEKWSTYMYQYAREEMNLPESEAVNWASGINTRAAEIVGEVLGEATGKSMANKATETFKNNMLENLSMFSDIDYGEQGKLFEGTTLEYSKDPFNYSNILRTGMFGVRPNTENNNNSINVTQHINSPDPIDAITVYRATKEAGELSQGVFEKRYTRQQRAVLKADYYRIYGTSAPF